ncbi:MAG: MFS transporter, partial [Fimbriimonas ginsengisoli]|nr:MFS transporter [Fimbriimonas ginsengisoli]
VLAAQFFPKGNPTAGLLSVLATFATGFVVRPFGALFFGRMGDIVGRKHTFLLTLLMMGGSTFLIGLIPGYEVLGVFAPILLVLLRLLQGLALGGEYGGAATYVAEHAPIGKRGMYTSFIQTTATLGLFVSLLVILFARGSLGEANFLQWGWRIPFLLSAVLVVFSYLIRRRMAESPLFQKIKDDKATSANPLKESFGRGANRRLVLIALLGATMGQGVVWYTGQFYALYFLQTVMNVQGAAANKIIASALVLGTPFFLVFGALSDRVGRKKLMMGACLLAAIGYTPIYSQMQSLVPVASHLPKTEFSLESVTDPVTKKTSLTRVESWKMDGLAVSRKTPLAEDLTPRRAEKPKTEVTPGPGIFWTLVFLVFLQVLLVTMVYGPIAAFLVELFPTRIRYTSMSLPYHIGNGVFGGLVPFIGTAMVARTGNSLSGLWYPIAIASITFIVGSFFIHEKRSQDGFVEAAK